jgi:hypothetical protein
MPKLYNVPANQLYTECIFIKIGFSGWQQRILIACDDGGLYFFRPWIQDPCLSTQISQILGVTEIDKNGRNKNDWRVEITIPAQIDSSLVAKLYGGVKVHVPTDCDFGFLFHYTVFLHA